MYIVIIIKEGSTKFVTFKTPEAGVLVLRRGHISHVVKMHYSFKNLLLYSQAVIRQSKYMYMYIVIMTKEGSTELVNLMTPGHGFLR